MQTSAWSNYSEFHQRSGYGRFPQEHRMSHGRLAYRMFRVEQNPHSFTDPSLNETLLALPLEVEAQCSWGWSIHGRKSWQRAESGRMLVVPAGFESLWEVDGRRTILTLCIPNDTFRSLMGGACPGNVGTTFFDLSADTWCDSFVEDLMKRLWDASAGRYPMDSYLADGLLTSIMAQLLARAGAGESHTLVSMPEWRLKRVKEFVESHLGDEIRLDDLAGAAGLSRRHFARSFQQQTGETPHRWLVQRRLETARKLLETTDNSLCDIASMCGFASQSHFTTALKQHTGMTPQRWRALYKLH